MSNAKILISIFHKPGKNDDNFEKLKKLFNQFDLYIPNVNFYGNKWRETKNYFLDNNYDSIFVICSDVSIVCGEIIDRIKLYANNDTVGSYGFGTIHNCTYNWLRYSNIELIKSVPFIEGYCFGANRVLFQYLSSNNVYGYGIDLEMGYRSHFNNLQCIVDNHVCISHQFGKSYDDHEATKEYRTFLIKNPAMQHFLNSLNIFHPLLAS